jgi:hypothetical protein
MPVVEGDVSTGFVVAYVAVELAILYALGDAARFSRGAFEACRSYKRAWIAAFVTGIVFVPLGIVAAMAWVVHRPAVKRAERNRGIGGIGSRRI